MINKIGKKTLSLAGFEPGPTGPESKALTTWPQDPM